MLLITEKILYIYRHLSTDLKTTKQWRKLLNDSMLKPNLQYLAFDDAAYYGTCELNDWLALG